MLTESSAYYKYSALPDVFISLTFQICVLVKISLWTITLWLPNGWELSTSNVHLLNNDHVREFQIQVQSQQNSHTGVKKSHSTLIILRLTKLYYRVTGISWKRDIFLSNGCCILAVVLIKMINVCSFVFFFA